MIKKIALILTAFVFSCGVANATHKILIDASNLTSGELPNERLDPSSVTLQGNTVNISTVAKGVNDIITGAQTVDGVDVSSVAGGFNTVLTSSNSAFLSTDGSTQTKAGTLNISSVNVNNLVNPFTAKLSSIAANNASTIAVTNTIQFDGFHRSTNTPAIAINVKGLAATNSAQEVMRITDDEGTNAADFRVRIIHDSAGTSALEFYRDNPQAGGDAVFMRLLRSPGNTPESGSVTFPKMPVTISTTTQVTDGLFNVAGGTFQIRGIKYVFPSSAPASGQSLHFESANGGHNYLIWGGN